MAAQDIAKNGSRGTIAAGVTAGATSIVLTTGHGARMPDVPFNAWIYNATDYADDPHDDPGYEIVRVTGRATDTLTVTRAQESTAASSHNTVGKSYRLVAGPTARTINYEVSPCWYNAKAHGCAGNGSTDDTVALQALINRVVADGGGRIFFPKGVYLIGGALQDTSGANAQLVLPQRSDASVPMTIDFVGETTPPTWLFATTPPTGAGYSIIKSTLTGATGTACLIGGAQHVSSVNANLLMANFRDLIFEAAPDPTITVLDLTSQTGNRIEHVLIHPGNVWEYQPLPNHTNSFGVKLPPTSHSSSIWLDSLHVMGFHQGVRLGELTRGSIICQACVHGIDVPNTNHPSNLDFLGTYGCPIGIYPNGLGVGAASLYLQLFSIQNNEGHGPAWQNRVADVWDPSNLLHGRCNWYSSQAGTVGPDHTFVKNGGVNFIATEVW